MSWILLSVALLFVMYTGFLIFIGRGRPKRLAPAADIDAVSMVIPFKDESENLGRLVEQLLQMHTSRIREIVFVNDHSTDNSVQILERLGSHPLPFDTLLVHSPEEGKKAAVRYGVEHSGSKWIIQTDADVHVHDGWIDAMCESASHDTVLIVGPVRMTSGNSLLGKFQAHEFDVLNFISQQSILHGQPTMGSAVNLLYQKRAFQESKRKDWSIPSGDDVFLIQAVQESFPGGIKTSFDPKAIVSVEAENSLTGMIRQRIRWASKNTEVPSIFYLVFSFTVFLFNASLVLLTIFCFFNPLIVSLLLVFGILKIIVDTWIYVKSNRRYGGKFDLPLFFIFSLLYPFYVTFVGFASFVLKPNWK